MKTQQINSDLISKILTTVDAGLSSGLGNPKPGEMCVEAAVCYAMGLPHGDDPGCVGSAVRAFKIALNDKGWSSPLARAKGLRRLAVAQLGSLEVNQVEFSKQLALETIRQILPIALRAIGLEKNAVQCEKAKTLKEAKIAAAAAAATNAAAAYAATNAANAAYAEKDRILSLSAEIAVQILVKLGSEGSKFLYLCE